MESDEASYRAKERELWRAVGLAPRERRIRLDHLGCDLRVQEIGDGPPVLFLHGGPGAGASWAPLIPHLTAWRCLLVDRPGAGLSRPSRWPPGPRALRVLGNWLVRDVVAALGVPRAHVVASSVAGVLALRSAVHHPAAIARLVQLGCPTIRRTTSTPWAMRLVMTRHGRWLLRHVAASRSASRRMLRQLGHGAALDAGRISDPFLDWYVALIKHTPTLGDDGELIAQLGSMLSDGSTSLSLPHDLLAHVRAPLLLYWGDRDTLGGAPVARALVPALPSAELVMVPRAGHLPWLDDPAGCASAIQEFLRRDRAPGRAT